MAKSERTQALAENEGLAKRLLDLQKDLEERDQAHRKTMAELRGEFARMTERFERLSKRVEEAMSEWERRSRELDTTQREAAEQVRQAGQAARRMEDRVKVLDQLRETAEDPRDLLKPIRRQIAELEETFRSNKVHTDNKIAALSPPSRAPAWETRG